MQIKKNKELVFRIWKLIIGLFIFAFGEFLCVNANIGLAPWDCFSMGISERTPLSFGNACILVSISVLFIDIYLREPIGLGMILDALLVGLFLDWFTALNFLPAIQSFPIGVFCMICGLLVMGIGQYLYISAGLGCGPRDAMLIGIGKRLKKLKIGIVQSLILIIVLIIGGLLGGKIGAGTVVSVVCSGCCMQIVFTLFHFEPRNVKHMNVFETGQAFLANK